MHSKIVSHSRLVVCVGEWNSSQNRVHSEGKALTLNKIVNAKRYIQKQQAKVSIVCLVSFISVVYLAHIFFFCSSIVFCVYYILIVMLENIIAMRAFLFDFQRYLVIGIKHKGDLHVQRCLAYSFRSDLVEVILLVVCALRWKHSIKMMCGSSFCKLNLRARPLHYLRKL